MSKKVLITGTSGGFGKLITTTLLQHGHRVVATMREVNSKNKAIAESLQKAGATIIEIDVTNEKSVNEGVNGAISAMNGLDVVINNAGIGVLGMQEFFTIADYQKVFDINVFGVQRINRAVLPHLRDQKDGLIMYTSSLLGRISLPFYGAYQASKWALEALAENYRVELSGFGIENCIVEPGGYPTAFSDNLLRPSDTSRVASYGPFAQVPEQTLSNFESMLHNNPQQNPQKVADTVANLITLPKGEKPFRTTVDFIGMAQPIEKYNEHLEQIMEGLYNNFGMKSMLHVSKQ